MPLIKPKAGEKERDFIERCLSDDTIKKEFPDQEQRLAVCYQQWREAKPKRQALDGPLLVRAASLEPTAIIDEDSRRVRVSFSSEMPVLRTSFFDEPWVEVLGHGADEVDMERISSGTAPLLYNHDARNRANHIGVVERAWIENGRGYAEIRLSTRPEVQGIWDDVRSSIINNLSVGYQIRERTLTRSIEDAPSEYRVTHWCPLELSLVTIGADASVGIGRSQADAPSHFRITDLSDEGHIMDIETPDAPEATSRTAPDTGQPVTPTTPATPEEAVRTALATEHTRRQDIRGVFNLFLAREGIRDLLDTCLDDPQVSVEAARAKLLTELGKGAAPLAGSHATRVEVGATEAERFYQGAGAALAARANLGARDDVANEFRGYSLLEFARRALELAGVTTRGLDRRELAGRALTMSATRATITHTTSDFPGLLTSTAKRSMLKGYTEAEETFDTWTSRGELPDFRPLERLDLNTFPALALIPEGAEYKYATIGERKQTVQLATYGRLISLSRQAIINDDLNAFTRIPQRQGRAAKRTIGNLVYAVLTGNPTMSDGVALFHANHGNLLTAAALSVAALDVAFSAMALMKGPDGIPLNLTPRYLIIPRSLEGTGRTLMESETDPAQANSRKPNIFRGRLTIVSDARLDAVSTSNWYLAADPNMVDTIEVDYLDGVAEPFLDQQDGWKVDGAEYKVRIDVGVQALDHRGILKNPN